LILRNVLLPGVVVPAVTAAVTLLLLHARGRRPGRGATGLALATGFLASFVAVSGWPRWPPVEATQRLFFVVAGAAVLSWVVARGRARRPEVAVEIAAAVLMVPLVLWALVEHHWSPAAALAWLLALSLGAFGLTRAFGAHLERGATGSLPASVRLVLILGIAVALGLSESLRLAQLTGALACSVAVVELLNRRLSGWSRADAVVVSTILVGLLLVGHFYAALEGAPTVLLTLALLLLWLPPSERRWLQLAPLLPLILALAMVIATFLAQEDDSYDYSDQRRARRADVQAA